MKNYIMEVEGYADRTGDQAYNRELSRKRAEAWCTTWRWNTTSRCAPFGSWVSAADFPDADNKTRAARKENRRVDIKIYTLDLNGQTTARPILADPQPVTSISPAHRATATN